MECSTISPTCPTCALYQGRIYSISGKTAGYPALYETAFKNGYSCIHPNCRHQFFPYNPNFHTAEERARLEETTRLPFVGDPRSEQVRSDYARSQMQMRQWNKEMNEFAEMQKSYAERGEEAPYKNLGAFRRAYRSEEGTLAYAKTHYMRRDMRQYEEFTRTMGKQKMPESLAKFQELKYNKDRSKYASLRIAVADEQVRRKLGSDELPLTIQADKQGKHIKGHKNFSDDKSYLAVNTVEEGLKLSQKIVDKYHGSGEMQHYRSGEWKHTERVLTDKVVGYALKRNGKWVETKAVMIHYSKKGTHIVPTLIDEV